MVSLVDSEKWAPLIGRMFIACGSIERTTHECIRDWAGEKIHKHFARARLSQRIDLVLDLAKVQEAKESTKEIFFQSLIEAQALIQHRNLIAHNPLCLVFLQNALNPSFIEAIAHTIDDGKFLSYEELAEIVGKLEHCAEKMEEYFLMFRIEKIDFEALENSPGF